MPVAKPGPSFGVSSEPTSEAARPRKVWLTRIGMYGAVAALALLLVAIGERLDQHTLRVPLLYHDPRGIDTDAMLILPMVKSTLERGSHWRNDQLGAPAIQEMHDFPVVDHFHFFIIWLLGRFSADPFLVFNIFYILTYPFAALTAMWALRTYHLSWIAAATGGLLYAFAPYHLVRGENHYFLSAYYVVPLTCLLILRLSELRLPFFPDRPQPWYSADNLGVVFISIVTASAGAYYAFFACALLVGAGLYGAVAEGTIRAIKSAGLVVSIIIVAGVVNHLPAFLYQARWGAHTAPTERFSEEAEYYGLKIAQLLLPIEDHSFEPLAFIKSRWNTTERPVQSWTERYSLGTVGAVGVLMLLARAVLPWPRRWPYSQLAALTLFAILVATIGGIGAAFNHLVSPQVRCYNRIAVYIHFFALFAVLNMVESWLQRRRTTPLGRTVAFIALGWFGLWDQTPFYWGSAAIVKRNTYQQEKFAADATFFQTIEEHLNPEGESPGPMVFQLPYIKWPESHTIHQLACYDHARGSLHTRTLRFSFGTMKGREIDEWYQSVMIRPPEQMLEHAAKAGFEAILLDKRGYTPARGEALQNQLNRVLGGARQIVHADGKQILYDLRPYRNWLKQQLGRSWEPEAERELRKLTLLWLDGFTSYKDPGMEWLHRWCGKKGLLLMVNPTEEPITFTTRFHLRTEYAEPATLSIEGGSVWTETLEIDKTSPIQVRTFTVPPGRHVVRFRCTPPRTYLPVTPRNQLFFIAGFRTE
ncbi:MAG: hypothetical protein ACRCZF_02405 [Gemmataceae bacterium]